MDKFDVVVVGAGAAGLCCAAELVLGGRRPLLICEAGEVGHTFRSVWMDERNRGSVQVPAWQSSWGGGWWMPLVRRLDLPVRFREFRPMEMQVIGTAQVVPLPYMASASAIANTFADLSSGTLSAAHRELIVSCLRAGLALPPDEVFALDRVRFSEWLRSHGATAEVAAMLTGFCGTPNGMTEQDAVHHLSAACALWTLRIMFMHEGTLCEVVPDPCEGLWIPIAKEVERRGGTVWRGCRVARVHVENRRAQGVELVDGTKIHANVVALATSNARLGRLFDRQPDEVREVLNYTGPTAQRQLVVFVLLNRPLLERPVSLSLNWPHGRRLGAVVDAHHTDVEPGKQLIHLVVTNIGDRAEDDVLREVDAGLNLVFPHYAESVEKVKTIIHTSEHWMDYTTVGPKLPRRSPSVTDLWYVGQGAGPVRGFWTEAAAGAGVLGARAIMGAAG